jgi:hypothetical protein
MKKFDFESLILWSVMEAALDSRFPGKRLFDAVLKLAGDDVVKQKALVLRVLTLGPDEALKSDEGDVEIIECIDDVKLNSRVDGAKGQFQCKCGSWETEWQEKQTSSGDEPSTLFVKCMKCKKRWTIKQ